MTDNETSDLNMLLSEPIPICVGHDDAAEIIYAHKEVLLKSRYFRALLDSGFAEAQEKKIYLPEDDADSVKSFITWLYTGSIKWDFKKTDFTRPCSFADKVCEEAYGNDLMDAVVSYYVEAGNWVDFDLVIDVYRAGLRHTAIARFGIKSCVWSILRNSKKWAEETTVFRMIENADEATSEMLTDFLKELAASQLASGQVEDPTELKGCQFHSHSEGSPCSKAKK